MYVIKEMRLNKFQSRPIVSNRALFLANGECPADIQSKDTSDCYDAPSLLGASKLKVLGLAQEIGREAIENARAQKTEPLNKGQNDL